MYLLVVTNLYYPLQKPNLYWHIESFIVLMCFEICFIAFNANNIDLVWVK